MPLLACSNLSFTLGTRVLLSGAALSIDAGERVGLVGRNGCGKTTFMRMLAGRIQPDSGTISTQRGVRIGYLTQDPDLNPDRTLRHEAAAGFAELTRLHDELDQVFHDLALPENAAGERLERLMARQSDLQDRIESAGGYAIDHKVDQILHGLGFTDALFNVPVRSLSGGQKGRLALAKLLLEQPDLLLLDEPTNHLDIAGCEWLEDFLNTEFRGAVLMISHDRRMLDNVVHRIEELEQGRLIEYPGNYTAFTEIRRQRLLTQARAYDNQQSQWAKEEEFIRRFRAGQRAKEAQGRLSKLERDKEQNAIDRPTEVGVMALQLPEAPRSGELVVVVREASKAFARRRDEDEEAPTPAPSQPDGARPAKVLFRNLTVTIGRGERWAIIGPNGAGKTSLVRAMLGELPLDSGSTKLGANLIVGHYQQLPPEVDGDLRVFEYLQRIIRAENPNGPMSEQQARDLAGAFLFSGRDQDKPIAALSGGERSRARLAGLLASAKNLLILDEPTNHLDIPSCERLEQALRPGGEDDREAGYTGTLILISHDRALIDAICDHLIVLDGDGNATVFTGSYSEYKRKLAEDAAKSRAAPSRGGPAKPAPRSAKPAESPRPAPTPAPSTPSTPAAPRGAGAPAPVTATTAPKPSPNGKSAKSPFSWMQTDRLEKEIEKTTAALKKADAELSREEVYRDADRCRAALAERDRLADELNTMEEEWLRRADPS